MKTRQVTVREGELLGPIDWDWKFECPSCMNAAYYAEKVETLRRLEAWLKEGEAVRATTDGGWPRCGWYPVLEVGMYDGWPYWSPYPSVLMRENFGTTWHSFTSITSIELIAKATD